MQTQGNLFTRDDTLFGVCQGIGEDFGFNPNWLRFTLPVLLFFWPVATILGYFGAGLVVFASRLIAPAPRPKAEAEAETVEAAPAIAEEALPLAA